MKKKEHKWQISIYLLGRCKINHKEKPLSTHQISKIEKIDYSECGRIRTLITADRIWDSHFGQGLSSFLSD